MGRLVGVEYVVGTGARPMSISTPVMPVHRDRPRDPFRSRDLHAGLSPCEENVIRPQSSNEPTRQRSHKTSLRPPTRGYDSKHLPSWQPQATNSGHGSPDGKELTADLADHRSRCAGSRGRPIMEFSACRCFKAGGMKIFQSDLRQHL